MAETHILYNGTQVSVVYDSEGHIVDAGDRIEGNPNGRILSKLIASGELTDLGPATEDTQQGDDAQTPSFEDVLVEDASGDSAEADADNN